MLDWRKTVKTKLALALTASLAFATPSLAAVTLSSTPGTAIYSGPTPTYDFESAAPVTGGLVTTGSVGGVRAQPFGSTGNYWTVGPSDGSPGTMDLTSFGSIGKISFIWGSVDGYNTLQVLGKDLTTVLYTFTGADAAVTPNGNQTSPITNPLALLTITGADRNLVGGLRLFSTTNAFEVDNFAIGGVPEPATWAMMLFGIGLAGAALRTARRKRPAVTYS